MRRSTCYFFLFLLVKEMGIDWLLLFFFSRLSIFPADGTRLQELDKVSSAAREARTRISLALKQAEHAQTQRVRRVSGPLATIISKQKSALVCSILLYFNEH